MKAMISRQSLTVFGLLLLLVVPPASLQAQTLAEALDTPGRAWSTGGAGGGWYAVLGPSHDGVDAVEAMLDSNFFTDAWIETTINGPVRLSFYYSEWLMGYTYSRLRLSVDGSEFALPDYYSFGWTNSQMLIGSGTHTVRWSLRHIDYYYVGPDRGWLDQVTLSPPAAPEITQQPQSLTRAQGESAWFTAAVFGAEPMSYQWRLNGTNVVNATNLSLTFTNVQPADAGTYSLMVSNSYDKTLSSNALLTVLTAPVITQQPYGQTVNAGSPATFTVTASGAGPLWYHWRLNGSPAGAVTTNRSYTIAAAQTTDAGLYSVVVSNAYDTALSSNALLTVRTVPVITSQPYGQTVPEGAIATFSASAVGPAPLCYQWYFNSNGVPGAANSALILAGVSTNQAGLYSVIVSNSFGAVASSNASLTVTPLPPDFGLGTAVDAPALAWRTYGWLAQTNTTHDGSDAAGCTLYNPGPGSCWMGTTVPGPGTLSFYWRVDLTYYPPGPPPSGYATFCVDGNSVLESSDTYGWQQSQLVLGAGEHALHWVFSRWDYGYTPVYAYVDQVSFVSNNVTPLVIVVGDGSLGFGTNGFGFNITGTAGIPIAVEASTNLASAFWTPLQSCTLTNGSIYFSDSQWTTHPARFYRLRSP